MRDNTNELLGITIFGERVWEEKTKGMKIPRDWSKARLVSQEDFERMEALDELHYVQENDLRHYYIIATGEPIEVDWIDGYATDSVHGEGVNT